MISVKEVTDKLKSKTEELEALEDKMMDVLEGTDIDVGLSVLTKIMCSQALENGIAKSKILTAIDLTYEIFETILEEQAKASTKH